MLSRHQRILLLTPLVLVVVPFVICPAVLGFAASFTNYAPFQTTVLRFVGLTNFAHIWEDNIFRTSLVNIVAFTAVTVSVELLIGFALAFALRRPFRGRAFLRFILLLPWLISPAASGVMWHYVLSMDNGFLNYGAILLGLPTPPYPLGLQLSVYTTLVTEIWRKVPLVAFLLLPGLLAIPAVYWDDARLDGLSMVGQVRHVVVPRLRVLLLTVALLLIGDALGTSESIFFLTGGGPGSQTMTPGLYSYYKTIRAESWLGGATTGWFIAAAVLLTGLCYLFLARTKEIG